MKREDMEARRSSERTTLELCGEALERGVACALRRNHDGDHLCQLAESSTIVRWKRRS
jgi:hypothetical protein